MAELASTAGSEWAAPAAPRPAETARDDAMWHLYERRYADIVGKERVIAGADCGFSSRASYKPEVHPTVVWPKFKHLAMGAELATKQLWG